MRPEARYLHTFRAVCEAGGLRAAASRLHRTEPSISYQIRRLEESLGLALFERRGRRSVPNAAGLRLWEFCRDYLDEWERLREDLRAGRVGEDPLRIAAVSGYGRYVLLPLFRDGPLADIPIDLCYPTAEDVLRRVETGDSDLGIVHFMHASPRLRFMPVAREELVLIVPAGMPKPKLTATSLSRQAFITYDESDYLFTAWFHHVLDEPPARMRAAAHFEELEEVADWVAAGRGISIVPGHAVAAREANGDIAVLRRRGRRCFNPVFAVVNSSRPRNESIQRTVRALAGVSP